MSKAFRKYRIWKTGRIPLCKSMKWNNEASLVKTLFSVLNLRFPIVQKYHHKTMASLMYYATLIVHDNLKPNSNE